MRHNQEQVIYKINRIKEIEKEERNEERIELTD